MAARRRRPAPLARPRTPHASEPTADTIVALATAAGESALGIVRLSGPRAVGVAASIVRDGGRLVEQATHTVRRVSVVDPETGELLDEALCAVMRAPRSYTGEDVVELSCHGSPALLRLVVERLVARGARLAAPGEFTRRAFLNGRMNLAQAEAVALLIGARTERAVALAARGVAGEFAATLRATRDRLLDVIAGLEVTLDFPEDAVGLEPAAAADVVSECADAVADWRARARRGRVVHEGLTVALVGAPNAGKSSLLNALLGRDRAIVSAIPGTTRDVLDATITLAGVPIRLLDTAGLDEPRDAVEAEGIRRTRTAMSETDLLIVVVDGSLPPPSSVLEETTSRPRILVRNKSDLSRHPITAELAGALDVSAVTGAGIDTLVQRLRREAETRSDGDGEGLVATLRQTELLTELESDLRSGSEALKTAPVEVALVDLRSALSRLSALLGVEVGDAVLDRIFATFCLGK
jgi:tRNA modification GTPase